MTRSRTIGLLCALLLAGSVYTCLQGAWTPGPSTLPTSVPWRDAGPR